MKRMKHPDHGFHHAYSPQEEETMRSNGWVDDDTEVKALEKAPELEMVMETEPEAIKPRRGRPPKASE